MEKCYPSWRYHATEEPRKVEDADHELETAHPDEGWKETPADLPAPEPPDPSYCKACGQKLPIAEISPEGEAPAAAPKATPRKPKAKAE